MNTYMDWVERRPQFLKLAERMKRALNSPAIKDLGVELERLCTEDRAPTPCEHGLERNELTPAERHNHFRFCLSHEEQVLQLAQWQDAARKWWAHQESSSCRQPAPEQTGHDPIPVKSGDMCVHVVLPDGAVLTLAAEQPPTPQDLEPFGERDKQIVATLLRVAQGELNPPFQYYGPVPVPTPAQAALDQLRGDRY